MKRFAALHDWPVLSRRASTATSAREGETKELVTWDAEAGVFRAWYYDSEGFRSEGSGNPRLSSRSP